MPIPAHIQQAIQAYYAERATPEDVASLEDWFREDESHIKIFAEHGMLEWQILCQQEKADAVAILTMLREAEEYAEPDYSLLSFPKSEGDPVDAGERSVTFHDLCSVAGYLTLKALRTKAGAIGSIAAVLVIGLVLYIAIAGPGGASKSPDLAIDDTPNKPGVQPNIAPAVATLTAAYNATWAGAASAAPAPGDPLAPGTQLTLTAGFAEITTHRGAVAILQAPATIELLDNNNALRLHAGKLVGICETESSKGFLVRTEYADIVDLGTRFGVAVASDQSARVEVFEGAVRPMPRTGFKGRPGFEPRELLAGEAFAVDSFGSAIAVTPFSEPVFASLREAVASFEARHRGITAISGQLKWSDQSPQAIDRIKVPGAPHAWVRAELWDHPLNTPIRLGIHQTGTDNTFNFKDAPPIEVEPGTVIRSYLITFKSDDTQNASVVNGQASFDGEVLGVIAFGDQWNTFRRSMRGEEQPIFTFGTDDMYVALRGDDLPAGDAITISPDRKTISFRLSNQDSFGQLHDELLRVIVRVPGGGIP
jgi:hypothetical protein